MRAAAPRTRLTIRARLTLTYGVLFATSAAAMAGLLYLFMRFGPSYSEALTQAAVPTLGPETGGARPDLPGAAADSAMPDPRLSASPSLTPTATGPGPSPSGTDPAKDPGMLPEAVATGPGPLPDFTASDTAQAAPGLLSLEVSTKADFLQALLVFSAVVFLLLLLISVVVGWLVAGRMLAPLQQITATARGIADSTLHERIDLSGPKDEIRELADTFNAMLRRLEQAFQAQRRFAANASHELRTPLASMRTILQVALASPEHEDLRAAGPQLLVLNRRSTEITEALLTLARADHGAISREPVDLEELARAVCVQAQPQAHQAGVELAGPSSPARTTGDRTLLRQLVHNLVDNAVRHNHRNGSVTVTTTRSPAGGARLTVRNTGPKLDQDAVDQAFEPFHRLDTRAACSSGRASGHGLGLAIVQSIVRAHNGTLRAVPLSPDGLEVSVDLPR
ncbi:ATP-binding protein [Streptomyces sp. NPDC047981]|uniref:ATP-binding protein n=1 Tax=Streptomyces sp. NPDC047981 TaxID=3154610 RepID=UPI003411FC09